MQQEIIFVVTKSLDGGYEAKALGHSIYTDAQTEKELSHNIRDAVKCHFDSDNMPSIIRDEISLNEPKFKIVWKMLQDLTADTIQIEELCKEEVARYESGFLEMEQGQYKTLEQIKGER